MLLWASTINCRGEQEPHDIGQINSSGNSIQIPRITVTEFDQWLGFPLDDIKQLQSINATNTTSEGIERIKSPFKCSDDWTLYGKVRAEGWPQQYSGAKIDFFLLHGRVQVISVKIYEEFPEILPPDSIWIDVKYQLNLLNQRRYYGIKQASGQRHNAIYPLEEMIKSQCNTLSHNEKDIGYQCPHFAISTSPRNVIDRGSLDHFTFETINHSDRIKGGPENSDILLNTLIKPEPPIYVDNIWLGSSSISSRLIIYRDKKALEDFYEAVSREFRDVECIQPI